MRVKILLLIIMIFLTILVLSSIEVAASWIGITYPPYTKMNTYPENGVVKDYTKCYLEDSAIICKSRVRYCVNASKSSGLTENYAFTEVYVNNWYDSCNAYAEFNKDPSYTNSPGHIVQQNEKVKFLININTYGEIYASKPTYPIFSEARIRFYIYVYKLVEFYPEEKWSLVDQGFFEYDTKDYGNMVFTVSGEGGLIYSGPPAGEACYSFATSSVAFAYAGGAGNWARANFMSGSYYNYINYLKMVIE